MRLKEKENKRSTQDVRWREEPKEELKMSASGQRGWDAHEKQVQQGAADSREVCQERERSASLRKKTNTMWLQGETQQEAQAD